MSTTPVNVNIPRRDMPFFRKLSKQMGWSYSEYNPLDNDAYREAMDDVANGRVYNAVSAEEMMAQILR